MEARSSSSRRQGAVVKPADLHRRIVELHEELECLVSEVYEATNDGKDDAPDTDFFLEPIVAAMSAFDGIELERCERALDPADVQRRRRAENEQKLNANPKLRAFVEMARSMSKKEGA
jgi:hypothetical protein